MHRAAQTSCEKRNAKIPKSLLAEKHEAKMHKNPKRKNPKQASPDHAAATASMQRIRKDASARQPQAIDPKRRRVQRDLAAQ